LPRGEIYYIAIFPPIQVRGEMAIFFRGKKWLWGGNGSITPFIHKRQLGAAPDEQILYLIKRSMLKGKILVWYSPWRYR
jgi:hypothetical protein